MEKLVVLLVSAAITTSEFQSEFPISRSEGWDLLIILAAATLTSLSNESSKQAEGKPFRPLRFFGNVGLCIAAGVSFPLLIGWAAEKLFHVNSDYRFNIGLSVLGSYFGRDALSMLFGLVKSAGELAARLKGMKISFDSNKDTTSGPIPAGLPEAGELTGGNDAVQREPEPSASIPDTPGGEGDGQP